MHPLPSSAPSTVSVLVVDAGSTLGEFTGESTTHVLTALTSVRPRLVTEAKHEILHRTPELTDAVIAQVCERLLINRDQWPDPWPPSGFTPYPEATDVLAELARLAPVVTLSNLSITRQPSMTALHHQFAPHLAGTYTSYHLGARKPQARLWHRIADDFAVPVREIVHIGDRVDEDFTGPLHAGARAILISRRGYHPPPPATPTPTAPPSSPPSPTSPTSSPGGPDDRDGSGRAQPPCWTTCRPRCPGRGPGVSGTHTARGTGAGSAGESRIPETTAAVSGQWVVLPCERRTGLPASVELYVTATGALYLHCPVEANEVRLCRDQLIALRDILAHALALGAHE